MFLDLESSEKDIVIHLCADKSKDKIIVCAQMNNYKLMFLSLYETSKFIISLLSEFNSTQLFNIF